MKKVKSLKKAFYLLFRGMDGKATLKGYLALFQCFTLSISLRGYSLG